MSSVDADPEYRELLNRIIKQLVADTGFSTMERLMFIPAFGWPKDIPESNIKKAVHDSEVQMANPTPATWRQDDEETRPIGGAHFKAYLPSDELMELFGTRKI
jgi:hypothetical protein